jgi:hypothetical protein
MSRTGQRIDDAARRFWAAAGERSSFGTPVNLERAVAKALPLAVVKLPELSTAKVAEVLSRIGTVPWTMSADRRLRACLVADVGVGLVFLDGSDPEDEQRFSLAHEVAHFVLHYLEPRHRVLRTLGTDLSEVLDRRRPPTAAERFSSAMAALALEPFRHAMARNREGTMLHTRTETMEAEADDLAIELVMPASEIRASGEVISDDLVVRYGLPIWIRALLVSVSKDSSGVIGLFKKSDS